MNKYLYHYTGLDTLFAILHWYKSNKTTNCIQLKASCIYNMNDTKEMYQGYDFVKKVLPQYEVDKNVPLNLRLSEVYNTEDAEKECKEMYILKSNVVDCYTNVPYVTCFSNRKDYLPMWSLYGKGGNGVCLIFDYSKLLDFLINNDVKGRVGNVVYNSKPDDNFVSSLDFWYNDYLKEHEDSKSVSLEIKIKQLSFICNFLSPFVKYRDYSYEQETRLIFDIRDGRDAFDVVNEQVTQMINEFSKIKETPKQLPYHVEIMSNFLNKDSQCKPLLPYVFKKVGVECISGIILGPCVDYNVVRPIVDRELKNSGIILKIKRSQIPYTDKPALGFGINTFDIYK